MQCKYICNWPIGLSGHAPAAAPSSSCRQLPDRKTFGCVTVHGAEHRECSPASQPRSSRRRPSPRRPRSSCEPPDLRIGRGCSDRRGIRPRHSGAARVAGMAPAPERKGAGRERRAAAADFLTRASAGIRSSGFPRSLLAFPSRHIPPAPEGAGCGRRRRRWVALEQDPGHWVDGVLPELSQRAVLTSGSTAGSPSGPKSEASSSRSGVRPRSGAPPRARSSRPGTPDGPCDTAPRYESPHPPRDRKGFPEWQSFAPPQRDRPAATVVYFCTVVCTTRRYAERAARRGLRNDGTDAPVSRLRCADGAPRSHRTPSVRPGDGTVRPAPYSAITISLYIITSAGRARRRTLPRPHERNAARTALRGYTRAITLTYSR